MKDNPRHQYIPSQCNALVCHEQLQIYTTLNNVITVQLPQFSVSLHCFPWSDARLHSANIMFFQSSGCHETQLVTLCGTLRTYQSIQFSTVYARGIQMFWPRDLFRKTGPIPRIFFPSKILMSGEKVLGSQEVTWVQQNSLLFFEQESVRISNSSLQALYKRFCSQTLTTCQYHFCAPTSHSRHPGRTGRQGRS